MKATPTQQQELLRLQNADNRLRQLSHTEANLPQLKELAGLAPRMEEVRQRLLARNGELEDARTELRRIESDVRVVETRMQRDSDRLQHTSSVKDVQALEGELAALRKRRDDLEEIELAVMERIEGLERVVAEVSEERDTLAAQVAEVTAARDAEIAVLSTQRAALIRDRAMIADGVPSDLLALYEKQRARYGIGAAALVQRVSMGSNFTLTGSDLDEIRRAAPDDVVLCPDSNCILVRGEDSGL